MRRDNYVQYTPILRDLNGGDQLAGVVSVVEGPMFVLLACHQGGGCQVRQEAAPGNMNE